MGRAGKAGKMSLCVWSICQCLLMMRWIGGRFLLYAVVKGVCEFVD